MALSLDGQPPDLEGWDKSRLKIAWALLYAYVGVLIYLGPPAWI